MADGIPLASFLVKDLHADYDRLKRAGVVFTQEAMDQGNCKTAILNDICGNLIQLVQMTS
jgi:hypothetical protein